MAVPDGGHVHDTREIAVIPGDDIGQEVMALDQICAAGPR